MLDAPHSETVGKGKRHARSDGSLKVSWPCPALQSMELYYGNLKSLEEVTASHVRPMEVLEDRGNGNYLYGCELSCEISGRFGFTVRAVPRGDERIKYTPKLLTWA